ncbi:MAG: CvpA family protein [Victivallales bacterium]|nr:CvpA family protein [Victivallales bacterium]
MAHYLPASSPRTTMRSESVQGTENFGTGGRAVVAMSGKSADAEDSNRAEADGGARQHLNAEEVFKALEMDEHGFNWRKDWWKYLCMAVVGLLVVMCGIRLTKMLFRLVIFLICLFAGVLGACYIGPHLTPLLQPHIPEKALTFVNPELVGYAAGFVVAYLIVTIVMAFLPKTVHGGGSKGK